MNPDVRDLIDRLGMTPLPVEGTFIVSTYRSEENISLRDTPRSRGRHTPTGHPRRSLDGDAQRLRHL